MRSVGVMGGTFDPIHHGHLVAASEVADAYGLSEVVFVPTGSSWQKAGQVRTDDEQRYLMAVIATANDPRFRVSRVDIDRPGDTYTVDTLEELHKQYGPDTSLIFITGADAIAGLHTWHRHDRVLELAQFVGVSRPGFSLADSGDERISVMQVPAMAISSTDIRRRVAQRRTIEYLVPAGVARFIEKQGLYLDTVDER